MMKKKLFLTSLLISYCFFSILQSGCSDSTMGSAPTPTQTEDLYNEDVPSSNHLPSATGSEEFLRDNTPVCLVPLADGISVAENSSALIDYSHSSDGYICVKYMGDCKKVKLRIIGEDSVIYTYDLHGIDYEVFPLTAGNGSYDIIIYENVKDTAYSTCLFKSIAVEIADPLSPYLYPNQYVNFNINSQTVAKAKELAQNAYSDMDVVTSIYNYITTNITYDYAKAESPPTGYTTDIDEILSSKEGICLDYAAVMASMLRSQQIPTRLEVGYAKDAYHAWISIYTEESGWLNGIIEFNGNTWNLVDPTFGANSSQKALKKFIGDGSNYTLQKMY